MQRTPESSTTLKTTDPRLQRSWRRLERLRRSGLFSSDVGEARITRACSLKDLLDCQTLVYESYLDAGYVRPNSLRTRLRPCDVMPSSATFVATTDRAVVGTLESVEDDECLGLPSDPVFKSELDALRSGGHHLAEFTNQAVHPASRGTGITTELMRVTWAHMLEKGYDYAIATVSPSHVPFYELIGFWAIGPVRSYSSSIQDPVVAMAADVRNPDKPLPSSVPAERASLPLASSFMVEDNPYARQIPGWQRKFADSAQRSTFVPVLMDLLAGQTPSVSEDQLATVLTAWVNQNRPGAAERA